MKKTLTSIAIVIVFILGGIVLSNITSRVNAQKDSEKNTYNHSFTKHQWSEKDYSGEKDYKWKFKNSDHSSKHIGLFSEDLERKVEIIENGITIEITSSDPETVTYIQEFGSSENDLKSNGNQYSSNITKDKEIIDNGLRITITSDDPDKIIWLQEKLTSSNKFSGFRRHHKSHQQTNY